MAVTGWKTAGTASSQGGNPNWANTGNTTSSDNAYATCVLAAFETTDFLQLTNFGFTTGDVPSGSLIVGIEVEVERKASGAGVIDDTIQLYDSGAIGTNKATGTDWPTSDGTASYGGAADTWAAGLLDTDIRDSGFGVNVSAASLSSSARTTSVDFVRLRIYYSVVTTITPNQASTVSSALTPTILFPVLRPAPNVATVTTGIFAPNLLIGTFLFIDVNVATAVSSVNSLGGFLLSVSPSIAAVIASAYSPIIPASPSHSARLVNGVLEVIDSWSPKAKKTRLYHIRNLTRF
jgi:hypothetical protein